MRTISLATILCVGGWMSTSFAGDQYQESESELSTISMLRAASHDASRPADVRDLVEALTPEECLKLGCDQNKAGKLRYAAFLRAAAFTLKPAVGLDDVERVIDDHREESLVRFSAMCVAWRGMTDEHAASVSEKMLFAVADDKDNNIDLRIYAFQFLAYDCRSRGAFARRLVAFLRDADRPQTVESLGHVLAGSVHFYKSISLDDALNIMLAAFPADNGDDEMRRAFWTAIRTIDRRKDFVDDRIDPQTQRDVLAKAEKDFSNEAVSEMTRWSAARLFIGRYTELSDATYETARKMISSSTKHASLVREAHKILSGFRNQNAERQD